ncbi:MAG: hypothetical protein JWO22_877 [Frankiales bacterium]|nr:hypothetical protein [Frankiales bacterium]
MTSKRGRLIGAAVLSIGLVGCGTTVPLANQRTAAGPDGLQVSGPAPTVGPGDVPATGPTTTAQGRSTGPGGTGAATPDDTTVAVPGAQLPTAVTAVPRGAPVEIGIAYAENGAAFSQSLGGSVNLGDGKAQGDALVSYLNTHGGLAGHLVKPVYYAVDLTRPDSWSVFVQEACTLWTQDHHVIAASFPVNIDIGQLSTCLKQHGAVLDASSLRLRSERDYSAGPLLVEPWMITVERLAPLYVRGLQQAGYFKGKPVIGVLSYDYPQSRLLAKLIDSELHKIGLSVKVTFEARYADSTSGLGSTVSEVQSAVLKFRSAGVTHVMSSAVPGGIGVAFQPGAQSQGYHPRYGLTSYDAIAGMDANQVTGAMAVGWWLDDVDSRHEISNATTRTCRSIFRSNGSANSRDTELLALAYCDFFLMLQHTTQALAPGARLDGNAVVRLLDQTASTFRSSRSLGTALSTKQRDGASGLRQLRFDGPCSCWTYGGRVSS